MEYVKNKAQAREPCSHNPAIQRISVKFTQLLRVQEVLIVAPRASDMGTCRSRLNPAILHPVTTPDRSPDLVKAVGTHHHI